MLYLFLIGYVDILIDAADAAAFFDTCLQLSCTPKRVRRQEENGQLICRFSTPCARQLQQKIKSGSIKGQTCGEGGLPVYCRRLLHAPALAVGFLLALVLLVGGRLFLWDIEISAQGELETREIEAVLADAGLSRGAFLPRLDSDAVALAARQSDQRLAFVSVNLTGTVAVVQVRARAEEPEKPSLQPANLVASCDGIVTLPLVFEGACLVAPGEAVRQGQILASGVLDTDNNGIRLSRAAGQILAKTEQEIEVFVPFLYLEKCMTGEVKHDISVNFFGNSRKVFKNSGNISKSCDIIKSDKFFTVGERVLPLSLSFVRYESFEWRTARRSLSAAQALCEALLAERLAAAVGEGALLSYTVTTVTEREGVRLSCVAVIERDIAATVEFSVRP